MWDGALRARLGAAQPREEHKAGVLSGPAKRRPWHEGRRVRRAGHGGRGLWQQRARLVWRAHHAHAARATARARAPSALTRPFDRLRRADFRVSKSARNACKLARPARAAISAHDNGL